MTTAEPHITDVIDRVAQTFVSIADQLWTKGREQRLSGAITPEQYAHIKSACRSLLRRSAELITTSSELRLSTIEGSVKKLEEVTKQLKDAKKNIQKIEDVLGAIFAAVGAVTLLAAAISAPSLSTIGSAIEAIAGFATRLSAAAA